VPLAALLAAGVALELRRGLRLPRAEDAARLPLARLLLGLAAIALVVLHGGSGGVGFQAGDWQKHNAILRDLVLQPWPVAYRVGGETVGLVFYLGFYLPAAAAGKLAGWGAANAALFATTLAGALLAGLWLAVFAARAPLVCGLVFATFGGLDALGKLPDWGLARGAQILWNGRHLEYWGEHWQYFGNVSALFWAPHHHIAAWLGGALALDAARARDRALPALLALALAALWSPFAAIGVAALLPAALLPARADWRAQLSPANAAGAALGLVLALYYASRWLAWSVPEIYTTAIHLRRNGFLPAAESLGALEFARMALAFAVLEFGALGLLVALARRRRRGVWDEARLLAPALALLVALLFVRYGFWNDLSMRASAPALFVLLVLAVQALVGRETPAALRAALALVLALGAVGQLSQLRWGQSAILRRGSLLEPLDPARLPDLFEHHLEMRGTRRGFDFVTQYLGSVRAPFYTWLAAPVAAREIRAHEAPLPPASGQRGPQPPQVRADAPPLPQQAPGREPAGAAVPGAEADRQPAHPAAPHQEQGQRHVLELEVVGNVGEAARQRLAPHQAEGDVGVARGDAGERARDQGERARHQQPDGAVAARAPEAEQRVGALARCPQLGEVARVALPVGVELEDPRRAARQRQPVARGAGRPVPGVGLTHHAQLGQLRGQHLEDRGRGVARAVVEREQHAARRGRTQHGQPLAHHAGHGGGLVVHRHDGEELGVHGCVRRRGARG
jgi:hypothetical protein